MNSIKEKFNFYYIGIALLSFRTFNIYSTLINLNDIVNAFITCIIIICFIINFIQQKYKIKEIIFLVLTSILVLYTFFITKEVSVILTFLAIVSIRNVNINKALKIILLINTFLILIHMISYFIVYAFFNSEIIPFYNSDMKLRHTLFLTHPNHVGAIIMWAFSIFIFLNYKKIKINIVIGVILTLFVYFIPRSRTASLSIIILILMDLILNIRNNKWIMKKIKIITRYIFIILTLSIMILVSFYDYFSPNIKLIIDNIDNLLSKRIWFSRLGYKKYGYSILPQDIDYLESVYLDGKFQNRNLYLDCTYIVIPINYGIIYTILLAIYLYKKVPKLNEKELIFVLFFLVVSISENFLLKVTFAFPILVLASNIYVNKNYSKKRRVINNV